MNTTLPTFLHALPASDHSAGVIELPLLLAAWQAESLEREANRRRQTTAQLIRGILCDFLQTKLHPGERPARGAARPSIEELG